MHILIRYPNEQRVQAVLLAASNDLMRVAIESARDTVELHRRDGSWYAESGEIVEIEAIAAMPGTEVVDFCRGFAPKTLGAGSNGFASY